MPCLLFDLGFHCLCLDASLFVLWIFIFGILWIPPLICYCIFFLREISLGLSNATIKTTYYFQICGCDFSIGKHAIFIVRYVQRVDGRRGLQVRAYQRVFNSRCKSIVRAGFIFGFECSRLFSCTTFISIHCLSSCISISISV